MNSGISNIFLDGHIVALNDLLIACRRSLNHFRRAADLSNDDTAGWYGMLAHLRQESIRRIEEVIRYTKHFPLQPDPDRATVVKAVTYVRIRIADDEQKTLLKKAVRLESRVEKCLGAVQDLDWAAPIQRELDHIEAALRNQKQRIDRAWIEVHRR